MLVIIVILAWKLTRRDLPLFGAGFAVLFAGFAVLFAGLAKDPRFWHAAINGFFVFMVGVRKLRRRSLATVPKRTHWLGIGVWGIGVWGIRSMAFASSWLGAVLKLVRQPEHTLHHMLTQARVVGDCLRHVVVPSQQSSDHHF